MKKRPCLRLMLAVVVVTWMLVSDRVMYAEDSPSTACTAYLEMMSGLSNLPCTPGTLSAILAVSGPIAQGTGTLPNQGERTNMKADATPMPSQGSMITINGMEMYYEVYGEGPPLVLLHGFTQSALDWRPYIARFAAHYKLIIPDLRGHGHSTNPSGEFTARQSALDMFALLDHLEIQQFKAMGISYGGLVLLHMATQQPTRLEAMVLVGTGGYFPEQARGIMRQLTPDSEAWNWELLRQRHVYGDPQIRALLEAVHQRKDSYDDVNFTPPLLGTIQARTLVVAGDRDGWFPVSLQVELYTAIPQAYLWIVPNGDHVPIVDERATLFTETALAFLREEWE